MFILGPLLIQVSSLTLPAFTAYPYPNPDGAQVTQDGTISGWTSPKTKIEWGGYLQKAGSVHAVVAIALPNGSSATYQLRIGGSMHTVSVTGNSGISAVDFGTYTITKAEWATFWLSGKARTGDTYGAVQSLRLDGDAVLGAKFNLKTRRNAASVHLSYPIKDSADWFYNEVTAEEDPVATYYMACGFSRGYFGMQVNSPSERRIIFSIWDSGKEAVDRSKVGASDLVQLLAKGKGVYASGFGNEGTGGHSHWVYPWKKHETQKFLVHAQSSGTTTIYTAYFWSNGDWRLIASFSAPHDGKTLRGLYSFVEDFDGDNGNLKRKALYGPAWIHTEANGWQPLLTARFTHDGTGGKDRFDYDFGIERGRFYLQNGGFQGASPKAGSTVHLDKATSNPPQIDEDKLTKLAQAGEH